MNADSPPIPEGRRVEIRFPLRLAASLTGYAITAWTIYWWLTTRGIGSDIHVWDRVGDQVWAGISPYSSALPWYELFFYAPPWALIWAGISWLPLEAQALTVFAVELAALRYIAGSWLRVGYLGLCFVTGGELMHGNINLVIAAGLTAAIRGDSRLATLGAMAKLSPVFAIREWRGPTVVLAAAFLLTLPIIGWWLEWGQQLAFASTQSIGFQVPYPLRLAVAGGIVVVFRRSWWSGCIAAAVAIPGLYVYSIVLLYPLVFTRLQEPLESQDAPSLDGRRLPGSQDLLGIPEGHQA